MEVRVLSTRLGWWAEKALAHLAQTSNRTHQPACFAKLMVD